MYSELLDQLGAGRRMQRDNAANSNAGNEEPKPLVTCKAGKMALSKQAQEPPSFRCEADRSRGEIRIIWKDASLKWQWYDRRDREVRDEFVISEGSSSTFEKVPLTDKKHAKDRIFLWTRPDVEEEQERYKMYWMQDAEEEKDEELVASINEYLSNPSKAAPASSSTNRTDTGSSLSNPGSNNNNNEANTGSTNQVDALSSILENLGMPQSASSDMSTDEPAAAQASGGQRATLTLEDLQGAMAGIQQQPAPPGPVLSDVVTPEAITGILQNEDARARLMELLPPEQRSEEHLEDNLRSPAVQQTLRHLTATLMPEDDWSGFYTVLANFQLDPADGQEAIAAGNPIQAFLDCLLASVKKDNDAQMDEEKEEEKSGDEEKQGE